MHEKHLRRVKGKPILQYLVDRINYEFRREIEEGEIEVCIATGDRESNSRLASEIDGVELAYGDPRNIPKRHLDAAKLLGVSYVVSVDGDDVFCSTLAMRAINVLLERGVILARTTGLPLGMNASGYSVEYLEEKVDQANRKVLETGWGRIFSEKDYVNVQFPDRMPGLRFTLDYPEDLEFFRRILALTGHKYLDITDDEMIGMVIHEMLYEITDPIVEKYWKQFDEGVEKEIAGDG